MIWQELIKMALIGSENGQLPLLVLEKLRKKGIKMDGELAAFVLEGAAAFWQIQKAGFLLQDFKSELPEPAQEGEEDYCTTAAAFHLELLLNGFYKKALPEFFFLLQQQHKILLPELLPALFKSSLRNKTLWKLARPHIGARGKWLLQQNPDWQSLLKREVENPAIFEYLESSKEPEEFAYRCRPEKLMEIREFYEQHSNRWDWQTENMLKIINFRMNMLKAFEK
ncbi:MAG: DUF5691 domain-containing protein [Saprospiraceae bacterium]|nr:DUF5691 domain-containing protein [Saprospiraceae bacterium]